MGDEKYNAAGYVLFKTIDGKNPFEGTPFGPRVFLGMTEIAIAAAVRFVINYAGFPLSFLSPSPDVVKENGLQFKYVTGRCLRTIKLGMIISVKEIDGRILDLDTMWKDGDPRMQEVE